MNYTKLAVFIFALILYSTNISAQEIELDTIPTELVGSWLVTTVHAEDATLGVDSAETAALMDDLVNNNEVIYQFTLSTFTLFVNGENKGTCNYTLDVESNFNFDEGGLAFEEIVQGLVGRNLTATELWLEASSPDGESSLTFIEYLTKQP